MHGYFAPSIQGEQQAMSKFQGLINELLRSERFLLIGSTTERREPFAPETQAAGDDFDIMLAETIQAKSFVGVAQFSISPNL
jgi:hypothetical protein